MSAAELVRAVRPLVPAGLQVKDSAKQAKDEADELNGSMAIMKYFLLGFGALSLLVGAFVIFNTLSITVAQRTREFATLRTLGGSRKQVMRSVIAEGFVIGLLASVLGLLAGIGLAKGLMAMFAAMGVELPDAATVIASRTVFLSVVVGTLVTRRWPASCRRAARRACRRSRRSARARRCRRRASRRTRSRSASASWAVALAAVAAGLFGGLSTVAGVSLLGGGVLALFAGMALLAPRLVAPLARFVGAPARGIGGVAGELAGANAVRNPGRTASTAAALMIGITLVTLVAVLGVEPEQGDARPRSSEEVARGLRHRLPEGLPFRADGGDELARVAGVKGASHVRSDQALVDGKERMVTGHRPGHDRALLPFKWTKGSRALAGQARHRRRDRDEEVRRPRTTWRSGSQLALTLPSGEKRTLVVRGDPRPEDAS